MILQKTHERKKGVSGIFVMGLLVGSIAVTKTYIISFNKTFMLVYNVIHMQGKLENVYKKFYFVAR